MQIKPAFSLLKEAFQEWMDDDALVRLIQTDFDLGQSYRQCLSENDPAAHCTTLATVPAGSHPPTVCPTPSNSSCTS